ncbi:MAG: hypothetical protein ACREBE_28200 [bacterium]
MSSPRSIRSLILSWVAYWSILALVGLGPAVLAIWRATRGASDGQSSVNVAFGNGGFVLNVTRLGEPTYSAAISFLALGLWVAGPPLVAWLVWLMRNRKAELAHN